MTKKTEFEELYSEILYTDRYNKKAILLWYLDKTGLKELFLDEIIEKTDNNMFKIVYDKYDYEEVFIPIYNIYVVTHGREILLDRRAGYQGNKDLTIPELAYTFGFE